MKRKYIIIGSTVVIVAILSVFVADNFFLSENKESGHFNYKNTNPIIPDTYLGKTISEWQKQSNENLLLYHEQNDNFFENLGALVMKNEMLHELNRQNIKVVNSDFKVYSGMVLTSLPPHVSFEAFVNGTDGNTYRLSGMTQRAEVGDVIVSKLQFFDTSTEIPLESILSKNNTITIRQDNNSPKVIPYNLILYGNKDIVVEFKNEMLRPIRIQSSEGDHKDPAWYGPTILPLSTATMTFDKPGVYEWHARTLPPPGSTASSHMGGGQINILSDNMDSMSFSQRQQIGAAILHDSDIPWSGMGSGNNRGITLDFSRAIQESLPDYRQYYQARAEQLIPFDIPIIIEDPFRTE